MRFLIAIAIASGLSVGCGSEPSALCDSVRFSWALDDTSYSIADDIGEEEGIQIDLRIRVALPEGAPVRLVVTTDDESDEPLEYEAEVGEDGAVAVVPTLPSGRVRLTLVGDNGCREVRSARTIFVFDEEGDLSCGLSSESAADGEGGSWIFTEAADEDLVSDGIQVSVIVTTGRSDAEVSFVEVDAGTGESVTRNAVSPESGRVSFLVSVPNTGKAVRARCTWPEEEITRVSVTRNLLVSR